MFSSRKILSGPVPEWPGQRLSAQDFDRQVAKIQTRAAILNGVTALGRTRIAALGELRLG